VHGFQLVLWSAWVPVDPTFIYGAGGGAGAWWFILLLLLLQ